MHHLDARTQTTFARERAGQLRETMLARRLRRRSEVDASRIEPARVDLSPRLRRLATARRAIL